MKTIIKSFLAAATIISVITVSNVAAYQTCSDAIQVTFKNETNLYIDLETKTVELY